MQVAGINKKYNQSFGNKFYRTTRELDSSVMLSRGLIDTFGCTIPWLIMANNDIERKEKNPKIFIELYDSLVNPVCYITFIQPFFYALYRKTDQ